MTELDAKGQSRAAKKRARAKEKKKQKDLVETNKKSSISFSCVEECKDRFEVRESSAVSYKGDTEAPKKKKEKKEKTEISLSSTNIIDDAFSVMTEVNSGDILRKENSGSDDVKNISDEKVDLSLFPTLQEILNLDRGSEENIDRSMTMKERGIALLQSIISPADITTDDFFSKYWEKKPFLMNNDKNANPNHSTRFAPLLSKSYIEDLLSNHACGYGSDINVTNYRDIGHGSKTRITLDPPPINGEPVIADPKDIWSNFESGCSIRLLRPAKHSDILHSLLSMLELTFGCTMGANAYLTPEKNQGFAPHHDDVDAFVLQLEGRKRWRVYEPKEKLARSSSRDFSKEDDIGRPIFDVILQPGDVLYMPRGTIHQANTPLGEKFSLHLTLSAMQNWAWCDLFDIIMPQALDAATESVSLREGLPRNFLDYMGIIHEDMDDNDEQQIRVMQKNFRNKAKRRIEKVCKGAITMLDAGCDQIAKRFLSDRLPPAFTPSENRLSLPTTPIQADTMCRLLRPGIARLVMENDNKAVIYHCIDNSREYHGHPLSPLEYEVDDAPALEMLIKTIEPFWICVNDLVHKGGLEEKVEVVRSLLEEGILALWQPPACNTPASAQME